MSIKTALKCCLQASEQLLVLQPLKTNVEKRVDSVVTTSQIHFILDWCFHVAVYFLIHTNCLIKRLSPCDEYKIETATHQAKKL